MPVIKTLKNGVWTKVSSFGELATATSSLNGLMSSADKSKLDKMSNYSTDEQVIGTWIDGKPLYRKVFTTQLDNTTGFTNVNHGLTNVNVCMAKGFIVDSVNTVQAVPSIALGGSDTEFIRFYITNTQYCIERSTAFRVASTFTLIVEYTKTTD